MTEANALGSMPKGRSVRREAQLPEPEADVRGQRRSPAPGARCLGSNAGLLPWKNKMLNDYTYMDKQTYLGLNRWRF